MIKGKVAVAQPAFSLSLTTRQMSCETARRLTEAKLRPLWSRFKQTQASLTLEHLINVNVNNNH